MEDGRRRMENAQSSSGNRQSPTTNHQPPVTNHQPPTTRIQRTTLTGEVIEVETTAPASTAPNAPGMFGPNGLPNTHYGTPHQSPATPHQPPMYAAMNAAGVPYSAMPVQTFREQASWSQTSLGEKWELFLAIAAPILLLSAWTVHVAPHLIMWIGFIDLFVLSLAMGATGAVPSYDDSYLDVGVMLVVTFLFGPVPALAAYLILSLIRQECNTAIAGLLVLQIVVFQGMTLAFVSNAHALKNVGFFMMFGITQFFSIFVAFLGWLLSSFLRPVGE